MFDLYREETVADCHARITEIHVQLTLQSLLDTQILAKEAATTLCVNKTYTVNKRKSVDRNNIYNVLFRLDMSTDLKTLITR